MAVKTHITDAEFADILARYNLGAFRAAHPLHAGTVQTNYILETDRDRFVFRLYENRPPKSVGFEITVVRYLNRRGYPCPAPKRSRRGHYMGRLRGKPFVIYEFIEGEHVENPTEEQFAQLIYQAARLNRLTGYYRPYNRRYRWNYDVSLCQELARQAARKIATPAARAKLKWHAEELSKLALAKNHPMGICHCDFHFSNILFREGQFAALLDFDDANYTYLTFDLATLINPFIPTFDWNTWDQFSPGAEILDFAQPRRVVEEYQKHRSLSRVEKHHLYYVFKLSLLFDCVWYFNRGGPNDFYEKRKLDALNALGRGGFYTQIFA